MKITSTSTFELNAEEICTIGNTVDILNDMIAEIDRYDYGVVEIEDVEYSISMINEAFSFLNSLQSVGSAYISNADYEEDDEQLSFDDFDEGVEDYDGHGDDV